MERYSELLNKSIESIINVKEESDIDSLFRKGGTTMLQNDSSLVKYEEHINNKFPNGECLKDVEERLIDFCNYLLENYNGKTIALVAHKATQLALDVITKNITWEQAIEQDWRKTKNWQPGWIYQIE